MHGGDVWKGLKISFDNNFQQVSNSLVWLEISVNKDLIKLLVYNEFGFMLVLRDCKVFKSN